MAGPRVTWLDEAAMSTSYEVQQSTWLAYLIATFDLACPAMAERWCFGKHLHPQPYIRKLMPAG